MKYSIFKVEGFRKSRCFVLFCSLSCSLGLFQPDGGLEGALQIQTEGCGGEGAERRPGERSGGQVITTTRTQEPRLGTLGWGEARHGFHSSGGGVGWREVSQSLRFLSWLSDSSHPGCTGMRLSSLGMVDKPLSGRRCHFQGIKEISF